MYNSGGTGLNDPKDRVSVASESVVKHKGSDVELGPGMEDSIPLFNVKYGNYVVPVHGNRSDCHVEDLAFVLQERSFVTGVVNTAKFWRDGDVDSDESSPCPG